MISWGAQKWPPSPPTLRAPAKPWRCANVAVRYEIPKSPHIPAYARDSPAKPWRPSTALTAFADYDRPLKTGQMLGGEAFPTEA